MVPITAKVSMVVAGLAAIALLALAPLVVAGGLLLTGDGSATVERATTASSSSLDVNPLLWTVGILSLIALPLLVAMARAVSGNRRA